jgi:hypothetical protein
MSENVKKLKIIYRVAVAFFCVAAFFLLFPPLVRVFDRNDLWVGILPLSQFYILFFTGLVVVGMGVLYFLDKKFSNKEEPHE